MFKTILVDDERMSLEVLAIKLRKLAPEMEILATYQSAEEAVVGIRQLKPDVLFWTLKCRKWTDLRCYDGWNLTRLRWCLRPPTPNTPLRRFGKVPWIFC